ncbi:hypothetical protein CFN79_09405 [Chromobacterium vaccinii]|uniref:hypothetical protein n=1 Tax=Chromobacterium vaccinii TaxID=1108595 RepID=UPI000CE9667F|nr:hypothetical protein [Chromobacterium vaccinii]AVG16052.1 hypothetical protein CFN79_09405 [Chromobacterium vaccinii]
MSIQDKLPEHLSTLRLKGKTLQFVVYRGTALEDKTWSETHVSSTHNGYGQVSSVQSHNVLKRECWIRLENGKERVISLPDDSSFAVRAGQAITLIGVHSQYLEKDTVYYIALADHASEKWAPLNQVTMIRRLAGTNSAAAQGLANLFVLATLGIGAIVLMLINRSMHSNYVMPINQRAQEIAQWSFQQA